MLPLDNRVEGQFYVLAFQEHSCSQTSGGTRGIASSGQVSLRLMSPWLGEPQNIGTDIKGVSGAAIPQSRLAETCPGLTALSDSCVLSYSTCKEESSCCNRNQNNRIQTVTPRFSLTRRNASPVLWNNSNPAKIHKTSTNRGKTHSLNQRI